MAHRTFPTWCRIFSTSHRTFPTSRRISVAVVQHPPVVRSGQHSGVNPLHGHSGRTISVDHLDKEVVNLANCFGATVDIHGWRCSGAGRPASHGPGDQGQGRICGTLQVSLAIAHTFRHSNVEFDNVRYFGPPA